MRNVGDPFWYTTGRSKMYRFHTCQVTLDISGSMMTSSNGNIFALLAIGVGNSPHKGQWRGALMFSLICARINSWVNTDEAGDLRRHRAHYDVILMSPIDFLCKWDGKEMVATQQTIIWKISWMGITLILTVFCWELFHCVYVWQVCIV